MGLLRDDRENMWFRSVIQGFGRQTIVLDEPRKMDPFQYTYALSANEARRSTYIRNPYESLSLF